MKNNDVSLDHFSTGRGENTEIFEPTLSTLEVDMTYIESLALLFDLKGSVTKQKHRPQVSPRPRQILIVRCPANMKDTDHENVSND